MVRKFPWWVVGGAVVLAAAYLPTLATPFDFVDDGNLVYPDPPTTPAGYAYIWWSKVQANYEHLGPFRPTLWVHWELFCNLFGGDPLAWRAMRLVWTGLAAGMLLWLFRTLGLHPVAALLAGALAMWNPYRNEIWTSLTLSEGVAMPYALFALVAARKAAASDRPLRWELASAFGVFVALGCKNVFAALVPVQILLRMWPDGFTLREAWARNGWRSLALAATLAMPVAHYVYFKAHWKPGQYETHGPTLAQAGRLLNALKGAVSPDFMAAGLVLCGAAVWLGRAGRAAPVTGRVGAPDPGQDWPGAPGTPSYRTPLLCGLLLLACGFVVYLPMGMVSGRYTMPAVWGLDILFATLLTAFVALPLTPLKRVAWAGVGVGLALVAVAGVGKQEKFAARARMLWETVHYVEANAPKGAAVEWAGGDPLKGELDVEEGIHFAWHLQARGRGDVRVRLLKDGVPANRVELPPVDGDADFRVSGKAPAGDPRWEPGQSFASAYWMGRRHYDCFVARKAPPQFVTDAVRKHVADHVRAHIGLTAPVE